MRYLVKRYLDDGTHEFVGKMVTATTFTLNRNPWDATHHVEMHDANAVRVDMNSRLRPGDCPYFLVAVDLMEM